MMRVQVVLGIVLLGGAAAGGLAPVQASGEEAPQVEGVWRGTSECVVKNSPCHDETNVYRIVAVVGKPNRFKVTGSKIVDGQEIVMGPASNWDYDPVSRTLTTMVGNGHFRLKLDGDRMEGELSLADETVYRRIHLVRHGE